MRDEIVTFVGIFEKDILTYAICICENIGLFARDYLRHAYV